MTTRPDLILFDFDGVILDSPKLKTDAFVEVYQDETAERQQDVRAYQEANGGIGRREKFIYFESTLFGRNPTPEAIDRLCERFGSIVDRALLKVPMIAGAEDALKTLRGRSEMHVISGMPHKELVDVVIKRGLLPYFASVVGSPTEKIDAFAAILGRARVPASRAIAIGDSKTEYLAAVDLGIPFLGVGPDALNGLFPSNVPVIQDLTGLPEILGFSTFVGG